MNIHKLLFPRKEREINILKKEIEFLEAVGEFEDNIPTIADLMRDSLGLPMLNFANVDEAGKPPHFLSDLTDAERKNFIAEMESIYSNDRFQTVLSYVINLLGNHSIQVAPEEKMKNGRIAIVGIRTFMNEFSKAHSEFLESKKVDEDFDPLDVL